MQKTGGPMDAARAPVRVNCTHRQWHQRGRRLEHGMGRDCAELGGRGLARAGRGGGGGG